MFVGLFIIVFLLCLTAVVSSFETIHSQGRKKRRFRPSDIEISGVEIPVTYDGRGLSTPKRRKKQKKRRRWREGGISNSWTPTLPEVLMRTYEELLACSIRIISISTQQRSGEEIQFGYIIQQSRSLIPFQSGVRVIDELLTLGHLCVQLDLPEEALLTFYSVLNPVLNLWLFSDTSSTYPDQIDVGPVYRECLASLGNVANSINKILSKLPSSNRLLTCTSNSRQTGADSADYYGRLQAEEISFWAEVMKSPCRQGPIVIDQLERSVHGLRGVFVGLLVVLPKLPSDNNVTLYDTALISILDVLLDAYDYIPTTDALKNSLADVFSFRADLFIDSGNQAIAAAALPDLFASEVLRLRMHENILDISDSVTIFNIRMRRVRLLIDLMRPRTALNLLESMPALEENFRDSSTFQEQVNFELARCYEALKDSYGMQIQKAKSNQSTKAQSSPTEEFNDLLHEAEVNFSVGDVYTAIDAIVAVITSCRLENEDQTQKSHIFAEVSKLRVINGDTIDLRVFFESLYHCKWPVDVIRKSHYVLAGWHEDLGLAVGTYVHAIAAYVIGVNDGATPDYASAMLAAQALDDMGQYSAAVSIYRHLRVLGLIPAINTHLLARENLIKLQKLHYSSPRANMKNDMDVPPAVTVAVLEYWITIDGLEALLDDPNDIKPMIEASLSLNSLETFNYRIDLYKPPHCNAFHDEGRQAQFRNLLQATADVVSLCQRDKNSGFHANRRKHRAFQLGAVEMAQSLISSSFGSNASWRNWLNVGVQWRRSAQRNDRVAWADAFPEAYRAYLGGFSTILYDFGVYNSKYTKYVTKAVSVVLEGLLGEGVGGGLYIVRESDTSSPNDFVDDMFQIHPSSSQRNAIKKLLEELHGSLGQRKENNRPEDKAMSILYEAFEVLDLTNGSSEMRLLYQLNAKLTNHDSAADIHRMGFILEIFIRQIHVGTPTLSQYSRTAYLKAAQMDAISIVNGGLDLLKMSLVAPMNKTREQRLHYLVDNSFNIIQRGVLEVTMDEDSRERITADLLDATLELIFYWYLLNPLNRGSAMLGYMALAASLLAAGVDIKIALDKDASSSVQMDLEAVFLSDIDMFREQIKSTLLSGLSRYDEAANIYVDSMTCARNASFFVADLIRTQEDMTNALNGC